MSAFAAVGCKVFLTDAVILFLKRNLVSIFLPAGGVSSLAFFSSTIEKKGIDKSQINFASSIYGFVGILTVIILAIPAFSYALFLNMIGMSEWVALATVIVLMAGLYYLYRSLMNHGLLYDAVSRKLPQLKVILDEISTHRIEKQNFIYTIFFSLLIELLGVAHLYIAMRALRLNTSLFIAIIGYVIAVIFMIISPFLRGMGAVELSMTYLLTRFGLSNAESISATFLYRLFEFWLPLFAGVLSFILIVSKLLMRIIPALLLLLLGIINIISVLTPAISDRLDRLQNFIPIEAITASNYFVFIAGLFLLLTAGFMLKGLRVAWYFALILCLISGIGHITKAIDYEEAAVSFIVIITLIISRKEYFIKNNPRLSYLGIQTTLVSILAVFVYGIIGFYYLDKKHFDIDFNWVQSVRYTLENFFLIGSSKLVPRDDFARGFLYSINFSGFISLAFLIYTLVRPYVFKYDVGKEEREQAKNILQQYGNSSLDYFKVYSDKIIYKPKHINSFLSYRISGNFAAVLGNPIAASADEMKACIESFDKYCYESGLKGFFYRVPEESLEVYHSLGKRKLFIGQEGVVDLLNFTLEGGLRKSLRNSVKKVSEKGFTCHIHTPPVKDGVIQKIKAVSDEWLRDTGRSEIVFSQGMFSWEEFKQQTIITVESPEEKSVAFLNVIPDYARGEGTYDLIRKTADAPRGVMDFLIVELFNYMKAAGFTSVNLGFAPLSGFNDPHNLPERSIKFAAEKIKSFSHFRGLREFKEKFGPEWHNQYLVYEQDYDLLQVPRALAKVIKPKKKSG
jgi:phosphatidylglycerol lysyltransferase